MVHQKVVIKTVVVLLALYLAALVEIASILNAAS